MLDKLYDRIDEMSEQAINNAVGSDTSMKGANRT